MGLSLALAGWNVYIEPTHSSTVIIITLVILAIQSLRR
jgi:multidrug transporter EmrE-like cation transporter